VPIHFAAGSLDPMVSPEQLRQCDPAGIVIPGCGHNVHVEAPGLLWDYLEPLLLA
jgi:pimeloyl-ACP methyl ester carboxylesterase